MANGYVSKEEPVTRDELIRRITVVGRNSKADIVLKNGRIIDVFGGEIIEGDVAIVDGFFAGIGSFEGEKNIDLKGMYICPGFIDGHVHIESSMLTPSEFSKVLLAHGVTSVISDPHEIANVAGTRGIQYMLDSSEGIPLDVYIMLPSCVPSTHFETSGARLEAADLKPFMKHRRVLGLGEVMNYPAVSRSEKKMIDKLMLAINRGLRIDGHGAGLNIDGINQLMSANIRTDHECIEVDEVKERISRGMYVMIREGTAARNLKDLIGAVTLNNSRRFVFVTDDKHLDDLVREGSVDHNVRLAIKCGIPIITAIQMATINTAECFGLEYKGAIAPGYSADFMILRSLEDIDIHSVYKSGKLVAEDGVFTACEPLAKKSMEDYGLRNSVHIKPLSNEDFKIHMKGNIANVIEIVPNNLITKRLRTSVKVRNGEFVPSPEKDLLKIAVIQRHKSHKSIGLGVVKGFGIQEGSVASTVAHDSHNIIVVGSSDRDMLLAVQEIQRIGGGITVVKGGRVLASLPLTIGGLMCELSYKEALEKLEEVNKALRSIGARDDFDPLLTLSFLALPVIPDLKITDKGLFDVREFKFIDVEVFD